MNTINLHTGTIVLWCFAPLELERTIPHINTLFRWARPRRAGADEEPSWSHTFPGAAFVLCESYGEYNGTLGYPNTELSCLDSLEVARAYRRKHPDWSEAKIDRAVRAVQERSQHPKVFKIATADVLGLFATIIAVGNVTLILDDGGTVSQEQGGTAGRSESTHDAPIRNPISVLLESSDPTEWLPPPYWTPIVVRTRQTRPVKVYRGGNP